MLFREYTSNGLGDADENILCSPSNVSSLIDGFKSNLHRFLCVRREKGMMFQEDMWNGKRATSEKVLVLKVKCPSLLAGRNEFCNVCCACIDRARYGGSVTSLVLRRDTDE
jgi:hypothetical protein